MSEFGRGVIAIPVLREVGEKYLLQRFKLKNRGAPPRIEKYLAEQPEVGNHNQRWWLLQQMIPPYNVVLLTEDEIKTIKRFVKIKPNRDVFLVAYRQICQRKRSHLRRG